MKNPAVKSLTFLMLLLCALSLGGCGFLYRLGDGDPNYHGAAMQRYWDHSNRQW